ncbi:Centromere-associated protein E [Ooceraea biroi]|nr:Centromere-associated protein E [Ooceraea biroi]
MTAIICAVTPAALDETQCTLSFASRARNIKNKPELNEVMSDGVLLKRYAKQIDMLNVELEKMKQLAGTTDFLEMESKMQEKDRVNRYLEKRIKMLQTRIVNGDTRNNAQSFKHKAKRRQTWCASGAYKLSMSTFQPCANLSPIKEMSPVKSYNGKSPNITETSFQIAYADFELELIKNEEDSLQNDEDSALNSDEDSFITYRRQNRVRFADNAVQNPGPSNPENCNATPEKTTSATQTVSPGTPREVLRNQIRHLAEEFSQLEEYTTLEKQVFVQDHEDDLKNKLARLSKLEREMQNIVSDKENFEHIASDLRKKLTAAELRCAMAEEQVQAQTNKLQKVPELEKRIAQLSTQQMEAQNVPELRKQVSLLTAERDSYEHVASDLRKKLNESERRNVLLEDKLATPNGETSVVQTPSEALEDRQSALETRIAALVSEKDELQRKVADLQDKLTEAESCNNSMKDQLSEQQSVLQNLQDLETQVNSLTSEKSVLERTVGEMQDKLRETEEINNSITSKLNEQQEEIQRLQGQEEQIERLTSERHEFELTIGELQKKLSEAEVAADAMSSQVDQQNTHETDKELEKQMQDAARENEADTRKIDDLEVTNETRASSEHAISKHERVISELQEKLKETELRNSSIEEELSLRQVETQRATDEQRKCTESFALERSKLEDTICELQEKSRKAELRNNMMQNRINEQESQLQKSHDLEREIECLTSRTTEFECTVRELQEKLAKAEQGILPEDEPNERQSQRIQEPEETQVEELAFEKGEQERVPEKLPEQPLKSPDTKDNCNDDEVNHLKHRINDLQAIVKDLQRENTHLKEHMSTKSVTSDHEHDLSDSRIIGDLSSSRISSEEDSARLTMDLFLKNQELDEIKHDVHSMKTDIINLQETIYLLTNENSELASKLSAEKECAEKSASSFQQTIDELYARNSKVVDEKLNAESNLAILSEQMRSLRSRITEENLDEKQITLQYEEQLSALTAKNTELLSIVAERMNELETLKESKSLLYEHDCMYQDKLTDLTEKYNCLTNDYNDLSTALMDKIEENDGLRQECTILESKLKLSLESKEDVNDDDAEQLRTENTLLKTEVMELKVNANVLTEEYAKMSNQLMETLEELDDARKINDTTLHLSTLFNNTAILNDVTANDESTKDNNGETKIVNLQEEVNHLTHLNRRLSELKLSTCIQCTHLKELNESRRMLKLEVKSLSHKLEDLQRKFDCKSARSDALIMKAKEDMNLSLCSSSLNASVSENLNVSYVEDRLQSLNSELQTLKEEHNKLSDLYKEKCNEIEELHNSSITDAANDNPNLSSVKKSPNRTRLDNVMKVMNDLQSEFETIKKNNVSVKTDLAKFTGERDSLLVEINSLRTANENLLQKLSENEHSQMSALEKVKILENEIADLTKKLQEFTVQYKEIENAKLILEIDAENLKEDKALKERMINELRQSLACLQHELDVIKEHRKELDNGNNSLEEEYERKLELLKVKNKELSDSKSTVEQELVAYSRESENKLTELNEKINRYTCENDYLKQELIKLRDIEEKFEKVRNKYDSKVQQDKTLCDDYKNMKKVLNDTSNSIIREIRALKPITETQGFLDKSVDELFQIFVHTILAKEKEIVRTIRETFDKERQKLEDEKRQSVDSEKRTTLWAKELENEIEKLQGDLSAQESAVDWLQKEVARVQQLLEERDRDRDALTEKISLLEADYCNVQTELRKYSKIDTENGEAVVIAQKRQKQAQEMIKSKETEFQMKLKTEKEAFNMRIEELTCTIDSFKTKNMEQTNNIEGLEANRKQLENIIDLKTSELMKSNQIIQKMQAESEQLTEAYNELTRELKENKLRIDEITGHLKTKNDELTEYKTNLEIIVPENKLLKQQINERKACTEQYKIEIERLKMQNTQEFDRLKDQLSFEELKNVELNKQIAELNNKNAALTEEMDALRDNHATLERKCGSLERRVRNSTSKIQAEEQMEELKDLNRSLRNNLDGASNRITELQAAKTDLMKQLVTLNSQHDAICRENQELKETLSSYKFKHDGNSYEKHDALVREKNQIALELEATKFQLNQRNKEMEKCADEIKQLTEKNAELDHESDELAEVIREHDAENTRLQDQLYTCRAEVEALHETIEALKKKNPDVQTRSTPRTDVSSENLETKIRELQLEIVSKNGKIATLELQILSGSYPYQEKCKELQEQLLAYQNKNSELKAEVKRLQTAMLRTCAKECDACKQRFMNKRNQACQTIPNNVVRFCSTSSGIIADDIKIRKLEKEKTLMKDLCRSRTKIIKEYEKRIAELEMLQHSSS